MGRVKMSKVKIKGKNITLKELRASTDDWQSINEEAERKGISYQAIIYQIEKGYYTVRTFKGLALIAETPKEKALNKVKKWSPHNKNKLVL